APNDRSHMDRFGLTWHFWAQAAKPTDHEVNGQTLARRRHERLAHLPVLELIHFRYEARGPSRLVVFYFTLDHLDKPGAHIPWRDQQTVSPGGLSAPGQIKEQLYDVICDLWIAGEETKIFVYPRSRLIVVAGADVAIAS